MTNSVSNRRLQRKVRRQNRVLERQTEQYIDLQKELSETEQRERNRLAEVLHDSLQQVLVAARIEAEIYAGASAVAADGARPIIALINEAIGICRDLTSELSCDFIDKQGFAEAVQSLAKHFMRRHYVQVDCEIRDNVEPYDSRAAKVVFECVRELLFNVVKHAAVDKARVHMGSLDSDTMAVTVMDDGVGFDADEFRNFQSGFGLGSVARRVSALGGRLGIISREGCGTRVTIILPCRQPHETFNMQTSPLPRTRAAS